MRKFKEGTIAVLLGGRSAEREVSIRTGQAVAKALSKRGYRVETMDPSEDMVSRLLHIGPAAAFVALHGKWGEDGCVQGLLECLKIPYTGSGVLASALAMDKAITKSLVSTNGIPTPEWQVLIPAEGEMDLSIDLPVVVKPVREGSSVAISIVFEEAELLPSIQSAANMGRRVLIERYVKGRELSVAILEGEPLGSIEIIPSRSFYDYEAKYENDSGTRYLYPAPIPASLNDAVCALGARAFEILGCSGVCRADFILDREDRLWFIEINTLPGMTETSLVPKIAAGVGLSFEELCERLLCSARLDG